MRASSIIHQLKISILFLFVGFSLNAQNQETNTSKSYSPLRFLSLASSDVPRFEKKVRLLEVSYERFSIINENNDPEGIIVDYTSKSYGLRLEAEFISTDDKFWETGIHFGHFHKGYTLLNEDKTTFNSSGGDGPNWQMAISAGYGYRIVLDKEIKLFTVSAGATINSTKSSGWGSSSQFDTVTNQYVYNIEHQDNSKRLFYPSLYANLNRDFRFYKKMQLSVNFRYNQGIIKSKSRNYDVETYGSDIRSFDGTINGTSWTLGIGFKYNLGGNKTRDNVL